MTDYPGSSGQQASGVVYVGGANSDTTTLNVVYRIEDLVPALSASIGQYPGSTAQAPSGTVKFQAVDGKTDLKWSLSGLENDVSGGIHIHTGTTCEDMNEVGGHYWNAATYPTDAWNVVKYNSTAAGTSDGTYSGIVTGFDTYDMNLNHAVVVHASDGTRIGCGTLQPAAGGIHIHEGTTCETSGGHYFNPGTSDPWTTTYAPASSDGTSTGGFDLLQDYTLEENLGHAVVVHSAFDGSRISCGVLEFNGCTTTANPTTNKVATTTAVGDDDSAAASLASGLMSVAFLVISALFC
jgi:Cu/Zn superoxide dismutase